MNGSPGRPLPVDVEALAKVLDKVGDDMPSVASSLAQWVSA